MQAIGADANYWDAHFVLCADIDLGDYDGVDGRARFNIIGSNSPYFVGVFDGNGHAIYNFTYNTGRNVDNIGLFGVVWGYSGEVKNIGLIDATVNAGTSEGVGSLVGVLFRGRMENCYSRDYTVTGDRLVGGLVGWAWQDPTMLNCYTTGTVIGRDTVGGLVGGNDAWLEKSYANTEVIGESLVGGLVGTNSFIIKNCYARGHVSGVYHDLGGLIGLQHTPIYNKPQVLYSYSSCRVSAMPDCINVGAFVGRSYASVASCFWDREVNPHVNGIGNKYDPNAIGETTTNMQIESTFTDVGWDFETPIWTICEGRDYPRLWWQVDLLVDIDIDELWMYQSLPGQTSSTLTVSALSIGDPMSNSSYSYAWEVVLPGDVSLVPVTVDGGGAGDGYWTFAARGCDEPGGLSDSGQRFTVRVTVTGDDYGNTGQAEAEFGIALLGDVNNDGIINVADRSIANAFWRLGSVGTYTLRDCDVNSDGIVNVADRSIANAVWRGILGQNSVSGPCPLR
jgi:hypothetical protein